MSDSFWPHGMQITRLIHPPLSPWVCSNPCPLAWWCDLTISSSASPFSFCLQSFPASGSFPMTQMYLPCSKYNSFHRSLLFIAKKEDHRGYHKYHLPDNLWNFKPYLISSKTELSLSHYHNSSHCAKQSINNTGNFCLFKFILYWLFGLM